MRKITIFLLTVVFIISCSKTGEILTRKVNDNEIGKEVICPVTKNKFNVTLKTKAIDYKGQTYYFCCPGCDSEFIKNPEEFFEQEIKNLQTGQQEYSATDKEIVYWTCSMHPQVRSDKPGKCPICAMALIPIYKGEEDKIVVDEKIRKTLGIKSQPVEKMHLTKTIRLPARVAYDHELYLAQQEYLSSLKNWQKISDIGEEQENRIKETLNAAKFRLSLLGYTDEDIEKLHEVTEPDKNLIYPGKNVWMHADIYEYDLHLVKPGQEVVATTSAYPGEKFRGIVRFIETILNPQTRSAKARIVFENPGKKLKLEMYADLGIVVNLGKHLSIPETALIDTGTRKIVYLDLGNGRYKMQQVKTGLEAEGYIQVLEGLRIGNLVVVDGNFILDSQSTLTGGQALLYGAAEEIKEKPKRVEDKREGDE